LASQAIPRFAQIFSELLVGQSPQVMMTIPVRTHLVAFGGNVPDYIRESLRHPAEHEECRSRAVPSEEFEHALNVLLDA
jgi:hypothetical protein